MKNTFLLITSTACCFSIVLASAPSVKADALDTWIKTTVPSQGYQGSAFSGVAFGNGRYVAVGYELSSDAGFLLVSDDGVKWSKITNVPGSFPPFLDLYDVTYGGGQFVAVGWDWYSGHNIYISGNGLDWARAQPQLFNGNLRRVAYGVNGLLQGVFVAIGDGNPIASSGVDPGYNIVMSYDGVTWLETMAPGSGMLSDVAFGAGRFVVVDYSANLFTSTDGYH